MANCEKCGKTFEPSADRTEVSSLRILCPNCEAERRAEKAARIKAAAAAQATARPAAPPPARATGTTGVGGGGEPRRAQSPAPGASRKSVDDGKKPTVGTGVRGAQAKALHGEPSKKLYHKPLKTSDTDHGVENFHPDVQRELRFLQQREGKVMKIAWIVCGVLLIAAGAFAFAAKSKRDAIAARADQHRQEIEAFSTEMQGFDVSTEAGAKQAIAHSEKFPTLGWKEDPQAGPAAGAILTKARMSLQKLDDEREQTLRLVQVEAALRDAASKPADELFKARRTIASLEERGDAYGADFATRVKAARATIDQTILKRLFEEASSLAKVAGESPEKMRAALNAYTKAEDEATAILDKVMRMKDEDTKKFYTNEFKRIVDESNAFVTSVFTPEVIERTPWTDLLAKEQKDNWQNYAVEGFRGFEGGPLEVAGPPAGLTANGLIDVPKTGGYRDFVIDMEFTLNKGIVDWLFRLGRRVDNTVEYYSVSTAGENALKPGVSYRMEASYIGSKLNVVLSPADASDLTVESGWTKMRKGAFGAQIHEGVELKITRLKVRILRGA